MSVNNSRWVAWRQQGINTKSVSTQGVSAQGINAYVMMGIVALFLTLTANVTFFDKATEVYPFAQHIGFIGSLPLVLCGVMLLVIVLLSYRYTLKAVLIFLLLTAAVTAYFTDTYGTVYDVNMLQNALQTDKAESADLFNVNFILRILLLGVLPSVWVAWQKVTFPPIKRSILQRGLTYLVSLGLVVLPILAMSKNYASFFREHKQLRSYTNPATPVYALGKLASIQLKQAQAPKTQIMHATDAVQVKNPTTRKPKLVVLVVGETARGDHVQLNGYNRTTFPQMAATAGVTNFNQVIACGTSTAYSVPCMFSYVGMKDYDVDTANYQENVLDTLHRLKVNILWRDNNSSSKGVTNRLPAADFVDYKTARNNTMCNTNPYGECRDVGMLVGLDDYVKQQANQNTPNQDTLIVLHQMGNHGPAYFKRYDKQFEKFTPVCQSNELAKCDPQSVINAFDNALLATDDFLAKTVNWLGKYDSTHQVAMLYVSDHGESLGENGIYLHGMPYKIAPKAQKHVASMFWAGKHSGIQAVPSNTELTHDAITPTLLKLFDVRAQTVQGKPLFIK